MAKSPFSQAGHKAGCYASGGSANWMAGAVKHKGALRQAAHRAGMSTTEFAEKHKNDAGVTGRRARLALTFKKFRPG
jgi:hypothetical protein